MKYNQACSFDCHTTTSNLSNYTFTLKELEDYYERIYSSNTLLRTNEYSYNQTVNEAKKGSLFSLVNVAESWHIMYNAFKYSISLLLRKDAAMYTAEYRTKFNSFLMLIITQIRTINESYNLYITKLSTANMHDSLKNKIRSYVIPALSKMNNYTPHLIALLQEVSYTDDLVEDDVKIELFNLKSELREISRKTTDLLEDLKNI